MSMMPGVAAAPEGAGRHEFTTSERARGRRAAAERRRRQQQREAERRKRWTVTERQLYDALVAAREKGKATQIERARRAWSKHLAQRPVPAGRRAR